MVSTRASARASAHKSAQHVIPADQQLGSPPTTPEDAPSMQDRSTKSSTTKSSGRKPKAKSLAGPIASPTSARKPNTAGGGKRKRGNAISDQNDTKSNGKATPIEDSITNSSHKRQKRQKQSPKTPEVEADTALSHGIGQEATTASGSNLLGVNQDQIDTFVAQKPSKKPAKQSRKLTLGVDPFPEHPHPTPEECHKVVDLLTKLHGENKRPDDIPPASKLVAGCGEVRSVLEALLRTRLSAATSMDNANKAIQGLVQQFPAPSEKIGDEAIDWHAVRLADVTDIEQAIRRGGLAGVKSKDLKAIVDLVYQENLPRSASLLQRLKEEMAKAQAQCTADGESETIIAKRTEIELVERNLLSLQHLYFLSDKEVFDKMCSLPGIGVKTAACVMLFCLRRESFAVDTHVWRLCKWLGWVPNSKVTADMTFFHCDVRVPDELKYQLHQLLIKHGKACPRCRAITTESSEGWDEGCVLEDLLKRDGRKLLPPEPEHEDSQAPQKVTKSSQTVKRGKAVAPTKDARTTRSRKGADKTAGKSVAREAQKDDTPANADEDSSELSDLGS